MSKASKKQMGIDRKRKNKERREGIAKREREKVHISKRANNLLSPLIILGVTNATNNK